MQEHIFKCIINSNILKILNIILVYSELYFLKYIKIITIFLEIFLEKMKK